jgi:hypothetical protein
MFGKKKDRPAPAAQAAKKLERGFFHVFSDKSRGRRVVFVGLLAWLPSFGIADGMREDPDTARSGRGAAQVEHYNREIGRMIRDSHTATVTGALADPARSYEENAALADIDARARYLAQRLALDADISEKDAETLARQFLRGVQEGAITQESVRRLIAVQGNAAFLRDARARDDISALPAATPVEQNAKARQIADAASGMDSEDFWYQFFLNYIIAFAFMKAGVNGLLKRGARRDDTLKDEARKENIGADLRDIREMLKPKGPAGGKPPAP